MMDKKLEEKVSALFGSTVADDKKLLEECVSICQIYNLDPQDLLWKWEALNFRTSNTLSEISPFTMDSIGALKETLRRNLAKEAAKKPQRSNPVGHRAAINLTRTRAPIQAAKIQNMDPSSSMRIKTEQSVPGPSRVSFKGPKMDALSRKDRAYRYMYEKISERSEALDDRIDEFGELIREHYNIPELGDPSSSTDEEITVVGRITHDSDSFTSGAKLTDATITLESSRMYGSGFRIALRFDTTLKIRGGPQGAEGLGFFPGAMVALKGKNGGGDWFLVTEILAIPPLKPPPESHGLSKINAESGEFSICIASGPYTPDADLTYKPWQTLLNNIKINKPAVILLIGPFIDVAHPKIKSGDVEHTPAQLFRSRIIEPLRAILDSCPGTIAVVVPSIRDIISRQAVYPQAELEQGPSVLDARIHMLPNPARFSINGITFAVSSVDVLFHLRKDEFVKRGVEVNPIPPLSSDDLGTDSMTNLCRHLLQQRSFYPIFPVPLDVSHEVNLDLSHSLPGLRLGAGSDSNGDDFAPDVLVLPSRFKQFSKTVHATTAVNPSFLVKGTYAMLKVVGKDIADNTKTQIQTEILRLEG